MIRVLSALIIVCTAVLCVACDPDPEETPQIPKPRGYPRIAFPAHEYKLHDSLCPYAFETPVYSIVMPDRESNSEPCWVNIYYPKFGAVLHVSYKVVNNNVEQYLKDSYLFATKHVVKANGLEQNPVIRDSAKVYGLLYDIQGNSASNLQFYLTDSTKNFLRGSLYFNVAPNIDSLEPVIAFIRQDIIHMIQTFRWKEGKYELPVLGKVKNPSRKEEE